MPTRSLIFATLFLVASTVANYANADLFGSGANSFAIEFVPVGNPGNPADTTGAPNPAGSVAVPYRIGKYEISEAMIDRANAAGGLNVTKDVRSPNKPATGISWFEAATFVNWLNTSSGYHVAYKVDVRGVYQIWQSGEAGFSAANPFRNTLAKYFIPSADEWYKAAYYNPSTSTYFDYPTSSDEQPLWVASGTAASTAIYRQSIAGGPADITLAGGLSPYGTMAQGGNVWEWDETAGDLS